MPLCITVRYVIEYSQKMYFGANPKIHPGIHRGPYVQRGFGIGSFLSGIFRKIVPSLFKAGKKIVNSDVAKQALKAGKEAVIDGAVSLASDAIRGEDVKKNFGENLQSARAKVADAMIDGLNEQKQKRQTMEFVDEMGAKKRKKKKSGNLKGKGKKKRMTVYPKRGDIFDR